MTSLKPIETVYKSYRFRSRLEARWAVFFERMGWRWVYEDQGFDLPSGKYLPDFFLSDLNAFWEVKPETLPLEAQKRLNQSAGELSGRSGKFVYVSFGDPLHAIERYNWDRWAPLLCSKAPIDLMDTAKFKTAAKAARQARFEHGEVPA